MLRFGTQPEPPIDWVSRLQDYRQIVNLVNGDTNVLSDDTIVARRLHDFLNSDTTIATAFVDFMASRPRV